MRLTTARAARVTGPLRVVALLGVVTLLVALPAVLGPPAVADADPVPAPTLPEETFDSVSEEVLVEMDDGVELAATVVRPSEDGETVAEGEFPVVLALTPYGRNGVCGCVPPELFGTRGMIGVVADVRGTGGSGGDLSENYFSPREAQDGAILVDHFGGLPESNGRVGMAGGSYVGITQYLTAARQPEHLAAITPMLGISDLYRDGYTHGGIPNLSFNLQYIAVQGVPGYVGTNTEPYLLEQTLLAKAGQSPPGAIAFDYLARPNDDDFYRARSPIEFADDIEVPVLNIGSWRDGLLRGQTEMYDALASRPGAQTRLHMDPCTHKGCGPPFAPLTDPPGRIDLVALAFEFLDHHLTGAPLPDRAPVEFYLQGRDEYRVADQWPPADVRHQRFELGPGGELRPEGETADAGATEEYVTNPAAGFSLAFNRYGTVAATPYVPLDQRLEAPQGVTFRTPALEEPMALAGPLALRLRAASTAGDTDWHAKLSDVAPDGSESVITEGALRASHRELDPDRTRPERPAHTHADPTPIEPGEFYEYDVEIWPTAYELPEGHRLQLRVTSTDLPTHLPGWIAFDREAPEDVEVHLHEPAVNTVRLADSHLLLPILAPADEPDRPGRGDRPGGPPGEPPQQAGRPDAGDDRPGRSEVAAAGSVLPATGTPEPVAGLLGALLLAASLAARVPRTPRQR